jgi:hypothetical protein
MNGYVVCIAVEEVRKVFSTRVWQAQSVSVKIAWQSWINRECEWQSSPLENIGSWDKEEITTGIVSRVQGRYGDAKVARQQIKMILKLLGIFSIFNKILYI